MPTFLFDGIWFKHVVCWLIVVQHVRQFAMKMNVYFVIFLQSDVGSAQFCHAASATAARMHDEVRQLSR